MKRNLEWVLACVGLVACSVSPVDYSLESGTAAPPRTQTLGADASDCVPNVPSTDPLTYPACACAQGGAARCVPSESVPAALASHLASCTGGSCIPDSIVKSGGAAPPSCESPSFGEGRCLSLCIPAVAEKASVLDRGKGDVCAPDERCAPCKNPLANGASTGVCEIGSASSTVCAKPAPAPTPTPGACVAPASCRSVGDAEGRCFLVSLPMVAAQKDLLPVSTCGADARCAPCFNPLTGLTSGACSTVACDAPKEPAKTLKECCRQNGANHGRCVPKDIVPASARDELDDDDGVCARSAELCVPSELLAPATPPAPCTATIDIPFVGPVGSYQGVCVSDCFDSPVPRGSCPANLVCAPKQ